jgi:hypothetical protein
MMHFLTVLLVIMGLKFSHGAGGAMSFGILKSPSSIHSSGEGSDTASTIIIIACIAGAISVVCYTCSKIREVCTATRADVYEVEGEDDENGRPQSHVECGNTKEDK